MMFDIKEL